MDPSGSTGQQQLSPLSRCTQSSLSAISGIGRPTSWVSWQLESPALLALCVPSRLFTFIRCSFLIGVNWRKFVLRALQPTGKVVEDWTEPPFPLSLVHQKESPKPWRTMVAPMPPGRGWEAMGIELQTAAEIAAFLFPV